MTETGTVPDGDPLDGSPDAKGNLTPTELPLFRVGLAKTGVFGNVAEARQQFLRFRGVYIQEAIEAGFLATLQQICELGPFVSSQTEPGHRETELPQRAGRALNLALNRPVLLRLLEEIAACGPLSSIEGCIVQTFPRSGDELIWHDDLHERDRRLAITINLGNAFEGGVFELRRKKGEMLMQHRYTTAGSALIFDVNPRLEHRVLPLLSGGPRRVYTGWAFQKLAR